MRIALQFFVLLLLALLSAAFGFVILSKTGPEEANLWQFAGFYLAVFVFSFALLTFTGYAIRRVLYRSSTKFLLLRSAKRQGALLGVMVVVLMLLQAADLVNLWTVIFLLVVFILFEFYLE